MGDLSRNFSRWEFVCNKNECGCGFDDISYTIVWSLQLARNHFKKKVTILSACRCKEHNKAVGGVKGSKHLLGIACDFIVEGVSPDEVADFMDNTFIGNNGLGRYNTFTHFDTRTNKRARWDQR